jgi:hypothetical protein
MIKYTIAARVQQNKNGGICSKEKMKALFTEEELAANGDLVSKYFKKTKQK